MTTTSIDVLQDFRKQMLLFLDELILQFPSISELVIMRVFLKDQIPIVEVMNHFIHKVLPLKEYIVTKNEAFFIENNVVFGYFEKSKVNHFKTIWRSKTLDDDNKAIIWAWFASFISLAERYQKLMIRETSMTGA